MAGGAGKLHAGLRRGALTTITGTFDLGVFDSYRIKQAETGAREAEAGGPATGPVAAAQDRKHPATHPAAARRASGAQARRKPPMRHLSQRVPS